MPRTAARSFLSALLLLCLGVAAGWWLRGWLTPDPAAQTAVTAEAPEPKPARDTPPTLPLRATTPAGDNPAFTPPSPQPAPHYLPGVPDTPAAPPSEQATNTDQAQRLRQLLEQQRFNTAMELYQEVERRSIRHAMPLRDIILEHLRGYLRNHDDALIALVDSFLAVHYDDIDVLLILAHHQQQSDHRGEAARTFQLIYAYNTAQPEQRTRVDRAFASFVHEVDQRLAEPGQWSALISFYNTLEQLGLDRAEERLRLAELHLHYGSADEGRQRLQALTGHATLGARAAALLEGRASARSRVAPPSAVGSVPLQSLGHHYSLPVTLDDQSSVRLVIDTGASLTTLTQRSFDALAHEVRFTEVGPQWFNTANGLSQGWVYRVDQLQLGEHRLSNIAVAVLNFDTPDNIDGLLGMNVLSQFQFEVNQDAHQLLLRPR